MIDEPGQKEIKVQEFLDDMRYVKGYSSIMCPLTDEFIKNHNRTFFYDGDVLEYQVGTKRVVKAIVDGDTLVVKKDGVEYRGEKARALFKDDADFKKWKKTWDGDKNALVNDACAYLRIFQLNHVCMFKELQLPREFKFCTIQDMMAFLKSREFESVQARYLPLKDGAKKVYASDDDE